MVDGSSDHDIVIVGASLAGCAAAIQLGRAGLRVAVVERHSDPRAFKRVCSHFIQASGIPAIERLGLLETCEAAGALRPHIHMWTRWGWIEAPPGDAGVGLNLRRSVLDPLVRSTAAETPGVDLMLGWTVERLLRGADEFTGVVARDTEGNRRDLRGRLTIGADGRDSKVAELSEVPLKTRPHNRIAYGGYFEGPPPRYAPDSSVWFLDPQWASAFPTDGGLTFYSAMPTKARLAEFKRDPEEALIRFVAAIPDAPPIRESRLIEPVIGKIEMTNRIRRPVAPGLALIGDAAMAADPLFGVGCGWAFQSAEWLVESTMPALQGDESLQKGLKRYRRRYTRELRQHAFLIHDYSSGRRLNPGERLIFSAAARDPKAATLLDSLATRQRVPQNVMPRMISRALAVNARHALAR